MELTNDVSLEPDLFGLYKILKQIDNDKDDFASENIRLEDSRKKFQETVIYLREAKARGYIVDVKELPNGAGTMAAKVIDG